MMCFRKLEQATLARLYALTIWLRGGIWRIRRPVLVGARALIVRDGLVLLIRHRSGRQPWSLPGGGVNRNETLAEAACREAHEESGMQVTIQHLLGVYDRFGGGVSNYIGVFVCTTAADPAPPRSLEIAEARFFRFEALPQGIDDGSRRRIAEYLRAERGLARAW